MIPKNIGATSRLLRVRPDKDTGKNTIVESVDTKSGAPSKTERHVALSFNGFSKPHACLGARTVTSGEYYFCLYSDMSRYTTAMRFLINLAEYYKLTDAGDPVVKTCAMAFIVKVASQDDFSEKYWAFAQKLHEIDMVLHDYDPSVSSDPASEAFELSFSGKAVFTTTLNSQSERFSRSFNWPTWVMNQLSQFDALRAQKKGDKTGFDDWQTKIRKADAEVDPSGVPNPVLVDHGSGSAVDQLSGSTAPPNAFSPIGSMEERAIAYTKARSSLVSEQASDELIQILDSAYETRIKPFL